MKVDGSLKSLLQGVSQQPPRDRLPGQHTAQENMSSDPVDGLSRRPPTDLVSNLFTTSAPIRAWHDLETDDGAKFLAAVHGTTVQVFDFNGTAQTVTTRADATAYLATPGKLRMRTIGSDTYIINRGVTPAMLNTFAAYLDRACAVVQILGGAYGREMSISIDGILKARLQSPDGSESWHSQHVRTTNTANILELLLKNDTTAEAADINPGSTDDKLYTAGDMADPLKWEITRFEDVIVIRRLDNVPFTIEVNDDAGNKNIKANASQVKAVEDLPRIAPHLMAVRLAEKTDPEEDVWFKFVTEGKEDDLVPSMDYFGQAGYWQECVAPDVKTTINKRTMPCVLKHDTGTGTFSVEAVDWTKRNVGSPVSNPDPAFIGTPIQDAGQFQGRMVLIAGQHCIMSKTDKDQDFFLGSIAEMADTDPIDMKSRVENSVLRSIVQHSKDLVIFSNQGQFVVFGKTKLTPETATMVLSSQFEAELSAPPVGAGRNVFFATNFGSFTGIREFFVQNGTDINDSRPITQHVKKYIQGKATRLTTSPNYETLLVHTDDDSAVVYVYQYIWSDTEKVLSSWHRWNMGDQIVYSFFDEELIYMVKRVSNTYYLLRMSLDTQVEPAMGFLTYLDDRFDVLDCYTQFYLPYSYLYDRNLTAVQGLDCPAPGMPIKIESVIPDTVNGGYIVTLSRDMYGGNVLVGTSYRSSVKPTMPAIKDSDGVVIGTGSLRLRNMLISLQASGAMFGRMLSDYGDGPEIRYTGRIVGEQHNQVGVQPIVNSTFTLPLRQKADMVEVELYTDEYTPMNIMDIEWQGQYNKRGRRISTGG